MLTDQSVPVTGSTSGIGLAIAAPLAGARADVMLNGFGNADLRRPTRSGALQ